jgi:hypothetical protein
VISCSTTKSVKTEGLEPYTPESKPLHDTIVQMDSLLFDAYNTCKIDVFGSMVSEDVEFYHDRGGLSTSKPQLVEAIRNNICGKVNRELLKGSIEVYPIPGYGAVEMGAHRFHNKTENSRSRYSKFVHLWHRESDGWKLARVISLH